VQRIVRGEHVRLITHARRKDRSVVDVEFLGAPDQVNGRFAGYWGLFQNVTERSAVEGGPNSEKKFSQAFLVAPSMVTLSTQKEHRFIDVNNTWVCLTGFQRDEAIGRTALELGLFENPEDFDLLNERVEARGGRIRDVECRFRMRDGSLKVGSLSMEEFAVEGEHLRLTVMSDITPLRRTEARSSAITRMLFANQERERARFARVLHDDIGQLLVACQLALDRLAHVLSERNAGLISSLDELRSHISAIFTGVQEMSQDVYSPTDGLLSIEVALQQLCAQTRNRFDIDIGYVARDVPDGMPADVSRCLFRLVQDALLYIARHSVTRRADVELQGRPGMIHLYIREFGGAFSLDARADEEVGLITMRERAALINGTFSLTWFPSDGTQIEVAVPIDQSPRVSAATQKTGAGAGGRLVVR